jgi:hypothetical protein
MIGWGAWQLRQRPERVKIPRRAVTGIIGGGRVAASQSAADAQIVYLQTDEVASPQFAVDRQVEHGEVTPTRFDLKPGPDIPYFLGLEGRF